MGTDDKPEKHFRMGLRGNKETAISLLEAHPMPRANKIKNQESRVTYLFLHTTHTQGDSLL